MWDKNVTYQWHFTSYNCHILSVNLNWKKCYIKIGIKYYIFKVKNGYKIVRVPSKVDSTLPLFIVWLFLLFNSLPTPSPHCHYLPFPLLLILHCPFTAFMIFLLFHHFIIMQCSSALYFVSLFNYLTPSWHSYPVQVQPPDVLFKAYFRVVLEYRYFNILWYSTISYCLLYTC